MLDQFSTKMKIFIVLQFATYFMAIHKWVTTIHYDNSARLFDLVFGAMPILNFIYVLEYWINLPFWTWYIIQDALGLY